VSTLGLQIGENCFFSPLTYEHSIERYQFQNIQRREAKFREKRFRDVEKSVDGKKIKTRLKYNSLPLSLKRYADDCN